MSQKADYKHTAALIMIAVGAVAVFVGVCAASVAIDSGKTDWFGFSAVCCVIGFFVIRRGRNLRNAAVADGSMLIETMEQANSGHTFRTETRKPTFLRKKEEERDGG